MYKLGRVLGIMVLAALFSTSSFAQNKEKRWCFSFQASELTAGVDWEVIREANVYSKNADRTEYNVGDTKSFWAWDLSVMPPENILVPATCRSKGAFHYVWIADDQWQNPVTQNDVDIISNAWETATPASSMDPTKGIYHIAVSLFGPAPDELDNDPRVHLLYMDLNDFDGYFNSYNQMTDEAAQMYGRRSNECEMLYLNALSSQGIGSTYMLGALAHEFQHMIHWMADQNEAAWINEGCSQLSWYLCGFGTDGQETFFANHPNNNLTTWEDFSDYGQVTLFFVYLYEQYGGAPSILKIVSNTLNGFDGIKDALEERGYGFDAAQMFSDWMIANFVNNSELDHGQYGYKNFQAPEFAIFDTLSNYPTGELTGNIKRWAGRCYLFEQIETQLNIEETNFEDTLNLFAYPDTISEQRLIPMDPAFQILQIKGFSQNEDTAIIVLANTDSSGDTTAYAFQGSDSMSDDVSPPYVSSSNLWGIDVNSVNGLIILRDECSQLDASQLKFFINEQAYQPVVKKLSGNTWHIEYFIAPFLSDTNITGKLQSADINGNIMTPFQFQFQSGSHPDCETGIKLMLPDNHFTPGDQFYLYAVAGNSDEPVPNTPVFVILEVFGMYFFAPDWVEASQGISYYSRNISTGKTLIEVLPEFAWPPAGNASDIVFWGAMTDAGITKILGNFDKVTFGWSE
ncbi:hypothetical protein JW979_00545 [bacterium]|nr:hypothetical protein [candidate division CSSED10-310 bacterium]